MGAVVKFRGPRRPAPPVNGAALWASGLRQLIAEVQARQAAERRGDRAPQAQAKPSRLIQWPGPGEEGDACP